MDVGNFVSRKFSVLKLSTRGSSIKSRRREVSLEVGGVWPFCRKGILVANSWVWFGWHFLRLFDNF